MGKIDVLTINDPKSPIAEAYRTLRTNIQFSSLDNKIQTIVITSSSPGEGKSTVASNLAVVTAQGGHKTILLDCDQRKSSIHRKFQISNMVGISNILLGDVLLGDAVIKSDIENLYILTSGIRPPNPAELLASARMRKLIEKLKEEYEYIIIDTPPVLAVTDAQIISKYSDGCILVTASGETDKEAVIRAKDLLEKINTKIIGVVLNKIDTAGKGYYGSYYQYYYGNENEEDGKRKKKRIIGKKGKPLFKK